MLKKKKKGPWIPFTALSPLSLFPPGFLKTLSSKGEGALLGVGKDAGAPALSSLLLLLQVLGALFLAIGLWAWGEKVRWWGRVWGCSGSRWWEGRPPPICLCSPFTGCSLQHLGADRSGRP